MQAGQSRFRRQREQGHEALGEPPVEVVQNYREGIFAGTNDVVERITGTPALSVPAFIEKNRQAFA